MANKVLGRDLRDLLSRTPPLRFIERAAGLPVPARAAPPIASGRESVPAPLAMELPFDPPKTAEAAPPVAPPVSALAPPASVPAAPLPEPAPAPNPELVGSASTLWYPFLLSLDVVLLVAAAFLAFDPRLRRPLGLYLAGAAVLVGALSGSLAFLVRARRRKRPRTPKMAARIHIRITRV